MHQERMTLKGLLLGVPGVLQVPIMVDHPLLPESAIVSNTLHILAEALAVKIPHIRMGKRIS